jgi:hypothetical protein
MSGSDTDQWIQRWVADKEFNSGFSLHWWFHIIDGMSVDDCSG